ncbi:MAG TPA: HI0074 family nucleotidyltransferase substrate-binding subunit [Spirochaetota bacterium]|nr:HI0074 family nucleotidyltransferase substrate-binding subunit [Spirochaetota bacterium]HPI91402.1 HI0074 family nucleotidyltransferase substrate-binding subunit [Spirochaetota bacterium]HPR50084.1 HI0074 family nucleotidyltransferase substrate-binding subunit [Spirochaetota bacterium]
MERLKTSVELFEKALVSLEEISNERFTVIIRDATIQRFEYTFEAMWKCLKIYLRAVEGIECNSPKGCFREYQSVLNSDVADTEILLEMTDMRNLTSHTYIEQVAQDIYQRILSSYIAVMRRVLLRIQKTDTIS